MARTRVDKTLQSVHSKAAARLNSLGEHLPPVPQPKISFAEYLPQAMAVAKQDEGFAWELARALRQASLYGGE